LDETLVRAQKEIPLEKYDTRINVQDSVNQTAYFVSNNLSVLYNIIFNFCRYM